MIKRIEVDSQYSNAPELPMGSSFMPNNDPVQIRSIDGLGPVKAEIASTPFATGRGELHQGSSTGRRNIVMNLGLNPDWIEQTMTSLRQLLYRYFMVESWVTLRFFTDELPVVRITGIVESFEPNIFAEDPEIQISILCPKPDFIDVDAVFIEGNVIEGAGVPVSGVESVIDYEGTAPTGFDLRIESNELESTAVARDMEVVDESAGIVQTLRLEQVVLNSDLLLHLTTVRSSRRIYNLEISTGTEINILAKMLFSDWPELQPGENIFSVRAPVIGHTWRMGYFNRFGGL